MSLSPSLISSLRSSWVLSCTLGVKRGLLSVWGNLNPSTYCFSCQWKCPHLMLRTSASTLQAVPWRWDLVWASLASFERIRTTASIMLGSEIRVFPCLPASVIWKALSWLIRQVESTFVFLGRECMTLCAVFFHACCVKSWKGLA